MATTDTRAGFRLPWGNDHTTASDGSSAGDPQSAGPADADPETHTMIETAESSTARGGGPGSSGARSARRPTKFMADLSKAMQAAAESAREETLARLQGEAKAHVEDVHVRSASEAADLRRRADDDVAAIREWSKAEIARIRDETETRITSRKGRLEAEIEEHAATIERRIHVVQQRVAAFEQEMTDFFTLLLAEEDPSRIASMAENLPEPPPFDGEDFGGLSTSFSDDWPTNGTNHNGSDAAAAAAAPEDELAIVASATVEDAAETTPEPADLDAAEAEALAAAGADDEDASLEADALAARMQSLVSDDSDARSTELSVTGLVSVASIAGLKRQLARLPDVQSVAVSSGPNGEFVFEVGHAPGLDLRDAIRDVPFDAEITGGTARAITLVAKDPENQA
jgi:hypothetical protein